MKNLKSKNILERIDDFSDICREAGTTEEDCNRKYDEDHLPEHERCRRRLELIATTINPPDFVADYDNANQKKWGPIFRGGAAGFGFRISVYGYAISCTGLGARLVYANENLSDFSGTKFTAIWKGFLIK